MSSTMSLQWCPPPVWVLCIRNWRRSSTSRRRLSCWGTRCSTSMRESPLARTLFTPCRRSCWSLQCWSSYGGNRRRPATWRATSTARPFTSVSRFVIVFFFCKFFSLKIAYHKGLMIFFVFFLKVTVSITALNIILWLWLVVQRIIYCSVWNYWTEVRVVDWINHNNKLSMT